MDEPARGGGAIANGAPLLEVRGVDFAYGSLQVLFGVDLEVPRGARVSLLGTNGAGKSTLLKVAAGLLQPFDGGVRFKGRDVTALPAEERVPLGMALVEGGKATFPSLTVRDNLRLGAYRFLDDHDTVTARIDEALDLFPPLGTRLDQPGGTLSGGEQQMLALGRALVTGPELLMIDELSLGLAPVVLRDVSAAVHEMADRGTTILLVEQSLNVAVELTELAYFMEKGEVRFSGAPAELLERGDLARSIFFGAEAS